MIPEIIIEYTVKTGEGAFGGKAYLDMEAELKNYYQDVEIIGENVLSPAETRKIVRGYNPQIVRNNLYPNHSHRLEYNNRKWILKSKMSSKSDNYPQVRDNIKTGLNPAYAFPHNVIWPEIEWWQARSVYAYQKLIKDGEKPSNIHIGNLLFTPKGVEVIHYPEVAPDFDPEKAKIAIKNIESDFIKLKLSSEVKE